MIPLELPYGEGGFYLSLSNDWTVEGISLRKAPPLASPAGKLLELLKNPVAAKSFDEIFSGKKTVAVVVPDATRKAGTEILLPVVLNNLLRLGITAENITIIFATGIHPRQSAEQKRSIVGREIFNRFACLDHNPCGELSQRGEIDGEPLMLNPHVAEADAIITIGSVKLHYLAGFGGGRKIIMPGVTGYEQCLRFHSLCLDPEGGGRHPVIGQGMLEGNPMHEMATRAARAAGVDFSINTVLDEEGNLLFISAGDVEKSFEEACAFAKGLYMTPIAEKADIVIASCGGYPADINFIQAHKSLDSAFRAVKKGGAILLLAECEEGTGNPDFLNWFDYETVEDMETALRVNFVINGQTAMATKEKTSACEVLLLSKLPPDAVRKMGMTPVARVEEGLEILGRWYEGKKPKVLVMKHAGILLPCVK